MPKPDKWFVHGVDAEAAHSSASDVSMCPRPPSCESVTGVDTSTSTGADILTGFLGTVKAWLSGSILRADDWAWTAAPRARLQATLTPSRAAKKLRSTLGQNPALRWPSRCRGGRPSRSRR